MYDVQTEGGHQNRRLRNGRNFGTTGTDFADREGEGVKITQNSVDVIYESPLAAEEISRLNSTHFLKQFRRRFPVHQSSRSSIKGVPDDFGFEREVETKKGKRGREEGEEREEDGEQERYRESHTHAHIAGGGHIAFVSR